METLQNVVFPNLDIPGDECLYVRLNHLAVCERAQARICFLAGGDLSTDTFYGGLNVATWKRVSPVQTLVISLSGCGDLHLAVGLHRAGYSTLWLQDQRVILSPDTPALIPVKPWPELTDGLLFVRVRALSEARLLGVRYLTADRMRNRVRLGLVITHFNRQAQVLQAVRRLERQVLTAPQAHGCVTLTVVDNSRNLDLVPNENVIHLPNRNLGGSGGFARGLLELERSSCETHALFMDDDASCEGESILRTLAILRFARSPRLAIAGALIDEAEPWRLLEKGAYFDGKCRPIHAGRDLRVLNELLWAERYRTPPDYGGWWFFAFSLASVRRYPFPFFVRGDDVFFSLHNCFDIVTLNGIACLAEDFRIKHGPMTAYLDARYHILHAILRTHGRGRALKRLVNNQFVKPLMGYHYASARAFTLALQHLTEGPQYFRENLDLSEARKTISEWTPSEKLIPLACTGLRLRPPRANRGKRLSLLARVVTLQGHLLPKIFLRKGVPVLEKNYYGSAHQVFRYHRVLYENWRADTGFIAERDTKLLFGELRSFLRALARFLRRLPALRREYAKAAPELASREFWMDVYSTGTNAGEDLPRQRPASSRTPPPDSTHLRQGS